jgi:hypothetical protein
MIVLDLSMHHKYVKRNASDCNRTAYTVSNDRGHNHLIPESSFPPSSAGNRGTSIGTTQGTNRSSNIPLPASHVPRTQSELQLTMDQQTAELRDVNMFYLLVNGIRERHPESHRSGEGIACIIQSRLSNIDQIPQPELNVQCNFGVPLPQLQLRIPQVVQEVPDCWSITGFLPPEEHYFHAMTAVHPEYDSSDEGDGVFDLDL